MKEDKKKENNIEIKEFVSALYKLIIAKTESLEEEAKLNKQFMKDHGTVSYTHLRAHET